MKFAHFSHVWNKPGMAPAQRYEQLWRELALAEECRFDFGFCVEHHFNPQRKLDAIAVDLLHSRRCAHPKLSRSKWVAQRRKSALSFRTKREILVWPLCALWLFSSFTCVRAL
jgi:hypothetical protein